MNNLSKGGKRQTDNLTVTEVRDVIGPNHNLLEKGPVESDTLFQSLMHKNSLTLNVLPSLLKDLYRHESSLQSLKSYIEDQISCQTNKTERTRLENLQNQLIGLSSQLLESTDVPVIDENKSIILTLMYGSTFTECLKILDGRRIHFHVCDENNSRDEQEVVKSYLQNLVLLEATEENLICIKVKNYDVEREEPIRNTRPGNSLINSLEYFELRRLVENAGLIFDKTGSLAIPPVSLKSRQVDKSDETTSPQSFKRYKRNNQGEYTQDHAVDLSAWYCSCDDYQRYYTSSIPDELELNMLSYQELTAKYTTLASGEDIIDKLLERSTVKHLDPIPICSHILAVLIIAYNPKECRSYSIAKC
ncbi:uncharacterized protein PRCAT00003198001 [Priceomyces carsonii]|uniref:uncharacterized protein n=1 Tax=Priceomyces carsonii TaxID=28549 RepID=UPI002ED97444|nr:unnamed protein product [Priceomyces carsonii]